MEPLLQKKSCTFHFAPCVCLNRNEVLRKTWDWPTSDKVSVRSFCPLKGFADVFSTAITVPTAFPIDTSRLGRASAAMSGSLT